MTEERASEQNARSGLSAICNAIRDDLERRNAARDQAIVLSRQVIRHCSESIRAIHRRDLARADAKLKDVTAGAAALKSVVRDYPDLYHTGYTQDALKEVAEAFITRAIIGGKALPSASELDIESSTYLKGLGEAATELRRFILDIMRREDSHSAEAEALLKVMDDIYDQLVTFDFPDALTHGLRRQTDVVRGVLERTRGDLTQSLRQQKLQTRSNALKPSSTPTTPKRGNAPAQSIQGPFDQGAGHPGRLGLVVKLGRIGIADIERFAGHWTAQITIHLSAVAGIALRLHTVLVVSPIIAPLQNAYARLDDRSGMG